METSQLHVIATCSRGSREGTLSFAAVVANLAAAGITAYFADYRKARTIYYSSADESSESFLNVPPVPIEEEFDAEALQAAIRGSQRGEVKYPQFLELSRAAGCVGYFVWITGRHVTYFGRNGETHIEHFPN